MAAKQTDVQEARNALRDAAEALDDAVEAFTAMGTLAWRDDTRELQAKVHELVAQFAVCFKDEPEQAPDDLTTRLRTIEAEDGEVWSAEELAITAERNAEDARDDDDGEMEHGKITATPEYVRRSRAAGIDCGRSDTNSPRIDCTAGKMVEITKEELEA